MGVVGINQIEMGSCRGQNSCARVKGVKLGTNSCNSKGACAYSVNVKIGSGSCNVDER